MQLTHTDGIEQCLLNAITTSNKEYTRKKNEFLKQHEHDVEISVTTLAQPPQAVQLKKRYPEKVVIDARRSYYKIMGDLMHKIAESYALPGDTVEERYGKVINARIGGKDLKVLVHGAADRYNLGLGYIKDYKYTGMLAMNYEKTDYVQQLNLLRFLMLPEHREKITQLANIFIFRDYRWQDAVTGRSKQPTFTKEMFYDVWPDEVCQDVLRQRLMAHLQAEYAPDDQLPECTREELWYTQSGFRVRHRTKTKPHDWSKLATGWSADRDEALLLTKKKDTEWRIEETHGSPKRCDWCDAAPFCPQFLARQQQPNTEEEDDQD